MSFFKMVRCFATMCLFWLGLATGPAAAEPARILLIGSPNSHVPGEHDFGDGILVLKRMLAGATDGADPVKDVQIDAYPYGWPGEEALRGASTVVMYLDGDVRHPLLDAGRRAQLEAAVKRGVGLVMLHQASTVPKTDRTIPLRDWLGGVRYGLANRTNQTVRLQPATPHPVLNGVGTFDIFDEFYPAIDFAKSSVPLLAGRMTPQFVEGKPTVLPEQRATVAWALDRPDGGRSVTFTGVHYLVSLDSPAVRKFLLNSIFWTAGLAVPVGGFDTTLAADAARRIVQPGNGLPPITGPVVLPGGEGQIEAHPWGEMRWLASGAQRSSKSMAMALMTLRPGGDNGRHYHPNADVVLHILSGQVRQVVDGRDVALKAGDTISIPQGAAHHMINTGTEPATVLVGFPGGWPLTDRESK